MSEKMQLYWHPMFRSVRIIWLIKEMGIEDQFKYIKFAPGKDADADATYRKDVHPLCTIPALQIPEKPTMLESGAIVLYLADRFAQFTPKTEDRLEYYDISIYGTSTLDELLDFYYFLWFLNLEFSEEKITKMRSKFNQCMEYLAERLKDKEFLCGEFTAADCIVGYDIYLASVFKDGELLKDHPIIREYYNRLLSRPAFKDTISME